MSRVTSEPYAVQLRPSVNVLAAPYGVNSPSILNCKLSKEQSMFPDDDRIIETCRSVLSVLM